MYVCTNVCMCVRMYVWTFRRSGPEAHLELRHSRAATHAPPIYVCVRGYVCIRKSVGIYVCMYKCMYGHFVTVAEQQIAQFAISVLCHVRHLFMYVCVSTYLYECVYVCAYVCTNVCMDTYS